MFQRYLYPALALIVALLSFNNVSAQNIVFNQQLDSLISSFAWSEDGSMLAISSQTALYIMDMHSYELRQLQAYRLAEGNDAPSAIFWSPDKTKLALIGRHNSTDYSLSYLFIIDIQADALLFSGNISTPASLAFSPDSRKVALTYSSYIGGQAYDSRLFFLDIEREERTEWQLATYMGVAVYHLAWSPDGNQVAVQLGGTVLVYNAETQERVVTFEAATYNFYDLAWSPDGNEIITYGYNLRRWNAVTGQAISSIYSDNYSLDNSHEQLVWLPDNTIIVTSKRRANVFDAQTNHLLYYYELADGLSAYWNPVGRFAVAIEENQLFIYGFEAIPAPAQIAFAVTIEAQPRSRETEIIDGLATWSPQGDILLTNSNSMTNLSQADSPVYAIRLENAQLDTSLFSTDGRIVALSLSDSATSHYEVQIWDVQANVMLQQFVGHTGSIYELEFNADNTLLASGSLDTTIRVWDLNMGEAVSEMWGHSAAIADIAFSPDSQFLASVGDETMRVWDSQTGEELQVVDPYGEYIIGGHSTFSVRFSPDGQHIVYRDKTLDMMYSGIEVRVWDLETETQSYFRERMYYLSDVLYSPNGDFLALSNLYADVKLFEAQSNTSLEFPAAECIADGLLLDEFRDYWLGPDPYSEDRNEEFGNLSEAHWLDISPDGQLIAKLFLTPCLPAPLEPNVTEDSFEYNTIWLMDTQTGAIQTILRGNESPAYRMFFSPDGRQLLTQHLDGAIKLWDVQTGEELSIAGL